MNNNWKKYLIITGIISLILAVLIPENIHYLKHINDTPLITPAKGGIDINIYGLLKILISQTLFWFWISFSSFIFLGFVFLLFKKQNNRLK